MKKNFKDILMVTISNFTTILAGVVTGFIIPKILNIEDYGLYKTFTLYSSYIGLLSLGIVDGIVLKYGNKDLEELELEKMRSIFSIYFSINIIFTLMIFFVCLTTLKNNKVIFLFIALNIICTNITGYFQQISQITRNFKEYSFRNILKSFLNILIVLILYVMFKFNCTINYKMYVLMLLISNYFLTIWYMFTYKELIFGKRNTINSIKNDMKLLIKNGFPLLIANLCSTLLLTLDRQFVNVLFENEIYAIYAFAYNLLSLVTVAVSAISTVLFPSLKRAEKSKIMNEYKNYVSLIALLIFLCISIYFPLSIFIRWYLPNYILSLGIFKTIFPGLVISSAISIIIQNYYKVLNISREFFKKSVFALIISFALNVIFYKIFNTPLSISVASIFSMIIWYISCDSTLSKIIYVNNINNLIYMLIGIVIFYLCSNLNNWLLGLGLYILLIVILSFVFAKTAIKNFINKLKY